jgi:hypothetical protein
MGPAFFEFEWDDTVEILAALHPFTAAAHAEGAASSGSIPLESPSQRVPWAPQYLQLPVQLGAVYLLPPPPYMHSKHRSLPPPLLFTPPSAFSPPAWPSP